LNPLPNSDATPIEYSIHQVVKEASLLFCLPDNPFFSAAPGSDGHAVQEATYACELVRFACDFSATAADTLG
jgi:glutamate dehydrogenase